MAQVVKARSSPLPSFTPFLRRKLQLKCSHKLLNGFHAWPGVTIEKLAYDTAVDFRFTRYFIWRHVSLVYELTQLLG